LIDDLGTEFGIKMHMSELRRTKQGPFSEKETIKIEDIKDSKKLSKSLLNLEKAIKRLDIKTLEVTDEQALALKQGKFLSVDFRLDRGLGVAINKGNIIALIIEEDSKIKPERVF
jgi:tRNA pseudouridine55 synthase